MGRSPLGAAPIVAAALVATLAFAVYTRTLLPGVDLGDTGGFQAAVLWPAVSARQAYPLYYNLAAPFVRATAPNDPARALNLFSGVAAAAAVGLLVIAAAAITGSTAAGVAAGLLLAFSYTFWSQAIIAEVYTLHLALIAACVLALHAYALRPGLARLAIFFALFAASFGNHLSMVLLLFPFTVFLLRATPEPRTLFRPAVILLAVAAAAAGALQYWPNLMSVVTTPDGPTTWSDRVRAFWFDTTKADWRETMVLGVGANELSDRLAMWWFDARQQFGTAGVALAMAGLVALWRRERTWAVTLTLAWTIATLFALTYNVGDSHVFFLPAHLVTAIFAGASVVWVCVDTERKSLVPVVLVVVLVTGYALWRGWATYPAIDRHDDRRGEALIARLTLGISDPDAMLVSSMNWQLENVLLYVARYRRPDLTWTRLADVLPHFPLLLQDQREIARDVVLTRDAAAEVVAAYGPLEPLVADPLSATESLATQARRVPRGAAYVLSILTPPRDEKLDVADLQEAIATLTGARGVPRQPGHFEVIAGRAGEAPVLYRSGARPFSASFRLQPEATPIHVRMDSWLPVDTFRRAGFGHVLRDRTRLQILERGVNLVWLQPDGSSAPPVYAASLFAPQPRFRVIGSIPQLANRIEAAAAWHPPRP